MCYQANYFKVKKINLHKTELDATAEEFEKKLNRMKNIAVGSGTELISVEKLVKYYYHHQTVSRTI